MLSYKQGWVEGAIESVNRIYKMINNKTQAVWTPVAEDMDDGIGKTMSVRATFTLWSVTLVSAK